MHQSHQRWSEKNRILEVFMCIWWVSFKFVHVSQLGSYFVFLESLTQQNTNILDLLDCLMILHMFIYICKYMLWMCFPLSSSIMHNCWERLDHGLQIRYVLTHVLVWFLIDKTWGYLVFIQCIYAYSKGTRGKL